MLSEGGAAEDVLMELYGHYTLEMWQDMFITIIWP